MSTQPPKLKYLKELDIIQENGVSIKTFVYYRSNGDIDVYTFDNNSLDSPDDINRKRDPQAEGTLIYSNSDGLVMTGSFSYTANGVTSTTFWDQDRIETTIKNNTDIIKKIKNTKDGVIPNFITSSDIERLKTNPTTRRIQEEFIVTSKDKFFGDKKAAQYPSDAVYGKKNSQDHLVISQYRYKSPRAGDIWGNKSTDGKTADIKGVLFEGIGRTSPLDEFLGLVRMPMPNAIQDSNNVAWGEDTINALEAAALRTVGDVGTREAIMASLGALGSVASGQNLVGSTLATDVASQIAINSLGSKQGQGILQPELQSRILATLGIETSAEAILARREGVVPNSNLELLFSGPTLRQFSFIYKMSPRSSEEATIVNKILRFFKQGMAAKKANAKGGISASIIGGRSYFLGTPNVFRLQYRTDENEAIKGLNRIKTCALTGTSVNYTPEGAFASYEKGQPVSVLLTLAFQELEPIYDTDYKYEGGDGERKDDTGEGYRWAIDEKEVGY